MGPIVIKWGIIGSGAIASKFAEDLLKVPNALLFGVASRDFQKANEFASKFKAKRAFGDYSSLVHDKDIDIVYIATPHAYHKEHTLLCLNHQKPVLCEKPFAMNSLEVEEMVKVAQTHQTFLMEAMWTAFLPHFRFVEQLIAKKHFGNIIELEADFGFYTKFNEDSRLFNKDLGGGSLLDIGIYPVFAALSFLGEPERIEAEADFYPNGTDASCQITFHYKNSKAFLHSTFLKESNTEAIIKCDNGTIKINSRFHQPSTVVLTNINEESEVIAFDTDTLGYNYEIEHANEMLRKEKNESDIMTFKRSKALINTL